MTLTDHQLLEQITLGGRAQDKATAALYKSYGTPLLRFFVSQGVSRDDALDVLQDVFMKIVKQAKSYSGQGTAKSWIWQVARNGVIDFLRKRGRLGAVEALFDDAGWGRIEGDHASEAAPAVEVTPDECVAQGLNAFAAQEPDRAYALSLALGDLSIEAIGEQIGRTTSATKVYLFQCRKKFAPYIQRCLELLND